MGLSLSFLPFLDACHNVEAIASPMLGLGTVKVFEETSVLKTFADTHNYPRFAEDLSARSLFSERYGVEAFECGKGPLFNDPSFDLLTDNTSCTHATYRSILNSGELEHLFDQKSSLAKLHAMTEVGGSIIHIAPVTWFNHSFYNVNPFFYRELARANGYQILVEAIHSRVPLFGEKAGEPTCYITRERDKPTDYAKGLQELMHQTFLPSGLLYMVALRKLSDAPFISPRESTEPRYAEDTTGNNIPLSCSTTQSAGPRATTSSSVGPNIDGALSEVTFIEFTLPSSQIGHDSGNCYTYNFQSHAGKVYSRLAKGLPLSITEDSAPLNEGSYSHGDIRSLGGGRSSLWDDHIYFSTSDNTDPRTNGRQYAVKVPAFVHFVEKLPLSGIKKFGV